MSENAGLLGKERDLAIRVARLERELAEARAALAAKPMLDRAQLFALTDALPVLVSVIGRDQRYEFVNKTYESWFGPEGGRIVGRHALDVLGQAAYDRLLPHFERAVAGERVSFETDIPYRLGGTRHVHATFAPRRMADGEVTGIIALVIDLSRRFVDETALRESEDHYRHAVELNPQTSWTSAPDGQLDHVSSRWMSWTGTSGLGSSYLDGLHVDDRARTFDVWQQSVATGEAYDIEHRVKMRDGSYRWMHSRAFPRRDATGRIVKWYGNTEDIHDRKLAEQKLAAEVAERNAILGQLAEGVIVADAEGRITFVNEAAARIHGVATLDVGTDDYARAYRLFTETGEPYPSRDLPLARAVRGEIVTEARWIIRRPDADVLAVGSARPVRGPDGTQIGAVLTLRDESAREMAEAMVRRSEARYRSLFESIDAGFCVVEVKFERDRAVDYRFIETNPAFERQTGLAQAEGRWMRDLAPAHEPRWFEIYGKVARTGEAVRFENHAAALGRWYDVHAYRVGEPGENRIAVLFNDITHRKAAEAAISESEARFRLIADSAPVPMWVTRLDRKREFVNRAYVDFLGISYEEAVDFDWRHVIHPEDLERIYKDQVEKEASLRPFTLEARYRNRNGEWRWLRSESQPRWGPNGEHVGFIGVAYDVTIAKEAELALAAEVAERTAERDRMWRLSQDILLIMSLDGAVRAINPAVERYGYRPDELAGRHFASFVHPDDLAVTAEIVARAKVEPVAGFETRLRAADGSWRWISWSATPGDGIIFAFGRDVTAEKARQAELEAAQDALRQSQKMEAVGQLTGGVAHDFNNLLTPIMGSLDMLRRRLPADDVRAQRTVDTALQATERAATLVQRLLAFARRQDMQARSVDVADLLSGMDELLARTLGAGIRVMVDVASDLPPARVDPNQLELAILNLSINARDAMPGGGSLTISAAAATLELPEPDLAPGRYVRIAVADNGVGMDAETMRRAIEPFFSTKGVGKGTGLGLSMVYGFAAQLGGALRLTSAPGLGTTAELWLPSSDVPAETGAGQQRTPQPALRTSNILLVDDEDLVRMGIADLLTDLGYNVVEARSGMEALSLLRGREIDFDLVVTDYLMPGMNGAELAEAIRHELPGLPMLLITGYTNLADGVAADLPRLAKPFRQEDFAAQVAALLEAQTAG